MKKLQLLEQKLVNVKVTPEKLSLIKGGDDKRGGFIGGGLPPGSGTHGSTGTGL